jgi:hypothetical protein
MTSAATLLCKPVTLLAIIFANKWLSVLRLAIIVAQVILNNCSRPVWQRSGSHLLIGQPKSKMIVGVLDSNFVMLCNWARSISGP